MNSGPKIAGPSAETVYSTERDDLEHAAPESPDLLATRSAERGGATATLTPQPQYPGLQRGDRVGRFTILGPLGEGGMGVVFTAYDDVLDRRVALKLVHERRAEIRWQARMLREAKALARLSHPNVVQIYEAGTYGDRIYLAMELVQGQTLRQWLDHRGQERHSTGGSKSTERPAPDMPAIREIIACFEQAGRGLAAAHSVSLVHRDFKPDNVLVSDSGRVYVVDFGLVLTKTENSQNDLSSATRHITILDRDLTQTGAIMGTTAYMSPEQLTGQPVSVLSDQFSFCVALHEALHLSRPYRGVDFSDLRSNVAQDIRANFTHNRAVPTWVQSAIDRGLAIEPEERWPSMHALLQALALDPRKARRRRSAFGLGATVLVGALAAPSLYESHQKNRCIALSEAATTPWSTQRSEIRRTLLATGLPFAEKSAERVEFVLDAWTEKWRQARSAACMGAIQGGPFTEERESCLDRELARFNSLVPLLASAESSVAQHVVRAAENLPSIDRCSDPKRLSSEIRRALDPATEAESEAVRALIFRANSLAELGSIARGLDSAREALELARSADNDPLIAEARRSVGELSLSAGKLEPARDAFIEAYYLSGRIGYSRISAETAVGLITLFGYHLAKPEEAVKWTRDAAMWLGYLDLHRETIGADYHNHVAHTLAAAGSFERALEHSEKALEILIAKLGPDHPNVAGAHNNIGIMQEALGLDQESLESAQKALSIATRTVGAAHPDTATAENNVGSWYLQHGDPQGALAPLQHSLEIRREALGDHHTNVADSLGNVGLALHRLGRHAQALVSFEQSLQIREAHFDPDHPDIALSLRSIASTQRSLGRAQEASDTYTRVLEIYRTIYGEGHPESAMIELMIGELALELGRERASIEYLLAGIKTLAAISEQDPALPAGLVTLARAYSSQGSFEAAIIALERAQKLASAIDAVDASKRAEIDFSLAEATWAAAAENVHAGRDRIARDHAITLARRAYERLAEAGKQSRAQAIATWIRIHESTN